MLDTDHRRARHVFAAAHAEDALLNAARRMSVAPRHERQRLRDGCAPAFSELRQLSRDHFAGRPALPLAIDELERAVARLADLPGVPEQGTPTEHHCPACRARLERRGKYGRLAPDNLTDAYCSPCLEMIMPILSTLRSSEQGFGTDAI